MKQKRFTTITDKANETAEKILEFSHCHPYYTQQYLGR